VDSGNALACFHVAKQLEYAEQVRSALHAPLAHLASNAKQEASAIEFFGRAGKFNHAVRIAKSQQLDDQLLSLALQAPVSVKLDVAEYFEGRNMNAEAVLLLQKAGHTSRAIDLCFRHQLFDKMQEFAGDANIDGQTDPVQLMKVAAFFVEHKKFDKAAAALASAKQFDRTIDICEKHNVKITEDMAEKLTACAPTKEENAEERARVLRRLAKLCKQQGLWTLATKKFTQAGSSADKEEAMECLIKSNDPDKNQKIMFFASTLKMQSVFVMAANYLQTLDWHSDGEILKNIVTFYTKAKAFDNLSLFYDACAQVLALRITVAIIMGNPGKPDSRFFLS
jgi:intraflagellar transport protein 140